MNPKTKRNVLVSIHGYAGDAHQVEGLMPMYTHHGYDIAIVSPSDSKIENLGKYKYIFAGERAYIGQKSWDRQYLQMKELLQLPYDWYLMNDSDSFCLNPVLPEYLFEDQDVVWNNEVEDFRKPGQNWEQYQPIPHDYHKGYDIIAMQPPYFMSRHALQRIVDTCKDLKACDITPYIDWQIVVMTQTAGLKHRCFKNCVSCESKSNNGQRFMRHKITHGAEFIHSVKSKYIMRQMIRHSPVHIR